MEAITSRPQPSPRIVCYGATAVGKQPRRERSTTRSPWLTRTRLVAALVWSLVGAAALLPLVSGPRIATAHSAQAIPRRLPAGCAGLGDGHGLFEWPSASCGGTQIHLRVSGFRHAQYVFLYLASPQGGRSDSPLVIQVGADGILRASVTIPSTALGPGKYVIEAIGLGTGYTTYVAYTVQRPCLSPRGRVQPANLDAGSQRNEAGSRSVRMIHVQRRGLVNTGSDR